MSRQKFRKYNCLTFFCGLLSFADFVYNIEAVPMFVVSGKLEIAFKASSLRECTGFIIYFYTIVVIYRKSRFFSL